MIIKCVLTKRFETNKDVVTFGSKYDRGDTNLLLINELRTRFVSSNPWLSLRENTTVSYNPKFSSHVGFL